MIGCVGRFGEKGGSRFLLLSRFSFAFFKIHGGGGPLLLLFSRFSLLFFKIHGRGEGEFKRRRMTAMGAVNWLGDWVP